MKKITAIRTKIPGDRLIVRHSDLKKSASLVPAQPLINAVMAITRQALRASASSILLSEEEGQKLIFLFADGSIGEQIKRVKISKKSGIAGWVAQNGTPLVENDVEKNKYFNKFTDDISGFKTRSIICVPMLSQNRVIGVIEVLNKLDNVNFDERDLQTLTRTAAAISQVIEHVKQTHRQLLTHKATISTLVSAVDARETCIRRHPKRVSEYALMGAAGLSLPPEQKQAIECASILHDIGKLGIPDSILCKLDTLNNEEREMINQHPVEGFKVMQGIAFLQEAARLVFYHHERYDGQGYPRGLRGKDIPTGSRLIAVADAFDNMTAEKSHRAALSQDDALTRLLKSAGSQFDPAAVEAFKDGYVKSPTSG
ncbi:MAG: HD domain-containing phosphohydrolase [Chloroflexota bacterium]